MARYLIIAIMIATQLLLGSRIGVGGPVSKSEPLKILMATDGKEPWRIDAMVSVKKPVKHAVFGYLVNITDSLVVKPGLLESWHWDFDEEIYVFKLKKGLKFHSGRLVNSRDIEFSFARWFLTDKPSFERNYVPNIMGAMP